MNKIISCYSTRALLKYAKLKGLDISDFLVKVEEIAYVLLEYEHWTNIDIWKKVVNFVSKNLNKTVFDVGCDMVKKEKDFDYRLSLIVLVPLEVVKKTNLLNTIVKKKVNRNLVAKIVSFDTTKKEMCLSMAPLDITEHCKEVCEYNKGVCKAIMELKGYTDVTILEPECCFKGNPRCFLRVTWTGKNKDTEKTVFSNLMKGLKRNPVDNTLGDIKTILNGGPNGRG